MIEGEKNPLLGEQPVQRLFWSFILMHIVLWTLAPTLFNTNLPLDTVEALAWGREWQLGYYKHPPLSAWLAELAGVASGGDWGLYLLSQLCIGVAFYAMWRLAGEFLPPELALISVLLLEGVSYHNLTSPEFNVNVTLVACWALVIITFWRAVERADWRYWVACGFFAALGFLTKYLIAFLLLPLFLFLVSDPRSRRSLSSPGPYLGLVVFIVVAAPHLVWIWQNDFITFQYGLKRAGGQESISWTRHLFNPLKFLLAQAAMLILPLLLLRSLGPLVRRSNGERRRGWFLGAAFLGPIAFYFALSALTGMKLRTMWGTPLFVVGGLFLVYFFAPEASRWKPERFKRSWLGLFSLLLSIYVLVVLLSPSITHEGKRLHFEGRELARQAEAFWQAEFDRPLRYVVADEWLGGNVGWYATSRPSVYLDAEPAHAPWVSDDDIRVEGAIYLWSPDALAPSSRHGVPNVGSLEARFGEIIIQPPLSVGWGTGADLPPAEVGWALIPPADRRR